MLLLDTHAVIWLDSGQPMAPPALEAIDEAAQEGAVLVSPVSAWELGLLVTKGRIALDVGALDWFERFLADEAPYRDYFVTADPALDLSMVVRPRTTPLLTPFATVAGVRHVWTTFSADQVDLDYGNPALMLEILEVRRRGVSCELRAPDLCAEAPPLFEALLPEARHARHQPRACRLLLLHQLHVVCVRLAPFTHL